MSPKTVLGSQVVIPGWMATAAVGFLLTLSGGGITWAYNVSTSLVEVRTEVRGINYRLERIERIERAQ